MSSYDQVVIVIITISRTFGSCVYWFRVASPEVLAGVKHRFPVYKHYRVRAHTIGRKPDWW